MSGSWVDRLQTRLVPVFTVCQEHMPSSLHRKQARCLHRLQLKDSLSSHLILTVSSKADCLLVATVGESGLTKKSCLLNKKEKNIIINSESMFSSIVYSKNDFFSFLNIM